MKEKIIQFGEGGFLRGFADWMIQKMNDSGLTDIGVVVVQPIKEGMCDTLSAQGCKYTHIIRGSEGVETTAVSCITRCIKPYDNYDEYLALAENPDFKFVLSNTTESGIAFVDSDKADDVPPSSFPAKVCQLLYKRFSLGLDGFVFLPCELIDKNGENLKKTILQYADLWNLGEDFIAWINEKNVFCNTLVDRINTGYPKGETFEGLENDKMLNTSEFFHLWVIEGDKNALSDLPFEKAGLNVIITDNLEMYRTRKVRILNGAHTSMIPYAMLEGIETVGDCMNDENMRAFLNRCVFDEIIPTLDLPEKELLDYAENVFERFSNPYIRHLCASISLNSVSKFKVRVLPSLLEYIKRKNQMPENLIFSLYKLIEFYKTGTPTDDENIIKFMREKSVAEILANKAFWDEDLSFLYDEVIKYDNK
ncbi:MAG: tagaturonate reductase [Clostridia bacterium]|nr:tagaturonate reductase [Clostridia bacterium]